MIVLNSRVLFWSLKLLFGSDLPWFLGKTLVFGSHILTSLYLRLQMLQFLKNMIVLNSRGLFWSLELLFGSDLPWFLDETLVFGSHILTSLYLRLQMLQFLKSMIVLNSRGLFWSLELLFGSDLPWFLGKTLVFGSHILNSLYLRLQMLQFFREHDCL